jgi:3,4-dihydroxy 2-butanone 4-phosphate synthase / GTP cyclohydrolase II
MSIGLATTEEIIEAAKRGEPYILVDADDRENEGDVIIAAQFATPDKINFMAVHARGLICLTITKERAAELKLPPMVSNNRSSHGTAFTVSIEAREGVTTGISAFDRARTIATAVDPQKSYEDVVSPGHVFPLVARDGGVLVRAGHTEAAVDISRLAGLHPSAVICEVMNDDGTMARLPDLMRFAEMHGLKIGTISDLIAYRRRSKVLVEKIYEGPFETCFAPDFHAHLYSSTVDSCEHFALVRGNISPATETLVRVLRPDMALDNLGVLRVKDWYD